jgi:hypothetical protein
MLPVGALLFLYKVNLADPRIIPNKEIFSLSCSEL